MLPLALEHELADLGKLAADGRTFVQAHLQATSAAIPVAEPDPELEGCSLPFLEADAPPETPALWGDLPWPIAQERYVTLETVPSEMRTDIASTIGEVATQLRQALEAGDKT